MFDGPFGLVFYMRDDQGSSWLTSLDGLVHSCAILAILIIFGQKEDVVA